MPWFTVLKMPPTSTGFQVMAVSSSRASGWMLRKARKLQGLEQSK